MVLRNRILLTLLFLAVCLSLASDTRATSPRLNRILPGGIQRGQEGVLHFEGERLADAQEIMFYEGGFKVTKLEPGKHSLKATIQVAADCRLGEHTAHVRTASGVTEFRTFFVESLPQRFEQEPNNDLATAQPIELNETIAGVVKHTDEDYFRVDVEKGQRLTAEVVAMRLGTLMFDTYIAIFDPQGKRLASATGTPFAAQDGIISIIAPEAGKYTVLVREADSAGSDKSTYRLHIGSFPRPVAAYPCGGKMGEQITLRYLGDIAGEYQETLSLPKEFNREFVVAGQNQGLRPPTPIPFRLFEHGNAFEAEPNNTLAEATSVELPLAFNGIIETPGDVDHFKFHAKKGQHLEAECYARRVRSALDPLMSLYDAAGKQIMENDDGVRKTENSDAEPRAPDSYIRFKVPADGEYTLRMTDHQNRGGEAFVYRVEFTPVKPWLLVRLPRVMDPNDLYGQYRQQIFIPRGNHFACLVRTRVKDFNGPMVLDIPELPEGVTMKTQAIPAGTDAFPVVFHAAEDAPLSGKLVAMGGHHADESKNIRGNYYNLADLLRGQPGLVLLKTKIVEQVPIVVVDKVPFRIEVEVPKVPLVRDGMMDLKVKIHRDEGFTGDIMLRMPFVPRGVATQTTQKVAGDVSEAVFPLTAHPRITPRQWNVYVLGSFSKKSETTKKMSDITWASSPLIPLAVDKQHVTVDAPGARCKQGESTQIFCKLKHITPFVGTARAKLTGLPEGVAAEEVEFNHESQQFVFSVKTSDDSPAGKHATLACEVSVPVDDAWVAARAGRTTLEIEKQAAGQVVAQTQSAPKQSAQKQPVKKKPAEASSAAPLSRLEQLRLESKQRAQANSKTTSLGKDAN